MQHWGHGRQYSWPRCAMGWSFSLGNAPPYTHTWKEPPAAPEVFGKGVKCGPCPTLFTSRDSWAAQDASSHCIAVFFIPRKKQWSMVPGFMKLSCLMVHLLTEPLNIRNWETVLKMRNKPTLSCLWYAKEAVLPMNFLTMPAWRQELMLLPASAQGAWESAFQKSIFSLFPVVISHWNNGFWPSILAPANRQGDFQSDASFSNHLKPH